MTARTYASPESFKQALEQRLRSAAANGPDFARRRQLLVFERFLARVVAVLGDAATLKGGLVLELRLERARTTRDVDLRLAASADEVLGRLQAAARLDLGDFLTFEVGADAERPDITNEGMQYEGMRFRAECRLAGKPYGDPFGVDAAVGDPMFNAHHQSPTPRATTSGARHGSRQSRSLLAKSTRPVRRALIPPGGPFRSGARSR